MPRMIFLYDSMNSPLSHGSLFCEIHEQLSGTVYQLKSISMLQDHHELLIPLLRYLPLDQAQNSCQYEYSSLHHIASFAQAGTVARDLSTGVLFLCCIGQHPNRSMPNMFRNKMMVMCISGYSPLHF